MPICSTQVIHGMSHHDIGKTSEAVNKFIYIRNTLSRVVYLDDEVNAHIVKGSAAFSRFTKSIWKRSSISLSTRLKVC